MTPKTIALIGGYALLLLLVVAAWTLRSASTIGVIAFFTFALTALMAADFSKLSAKGPGVSFQAERRRKELEEVAQDLARPGRVVLKIGSETQGQGHETKFGEIVAHELGIPAKDILVQHGDTDITPFDKGLYTSGRNEDEKRRRAAVERFMRVAAEWGWLMAKMGFKSVPHPVIEWDEEGTPRILYGEGHSTPAPIVNSGGRAEDE